MNISGWWFYVHEGRQESVHGLAELVALAAGGAIDANTLVWHEGLPEWRPASQVAELTDLLSGAAWPAAPSEVPPPRPTPPHPPRDLASGAAAERSSRPRFVDARPPAPSGGPAPVAGAQAFDEDLDLARLDFPEVVELLQRRAFTGYLDVAQLGVVKTVTLQEGRVVFAASTDPDERLGELLLRRGKISLAQYVAAAQHIEPDRRLGTVLVEQGALGPAALVRYVIEQVQEILYNLFQWTAGRYRSREQPLSADAEAITLRLSTPDILVGGIQRIESWSRVARGVGGPEARYERTLGWEAASRELKSLPESGNELLSSFSDGGDVQSICREARGLSDFEVCRLIWALRLTGLLRRL